jgi:hypothetical protein
MPYKIKSVHLLVIKVIKHSLLSSTNQDDFLEKDLRIKSTYLRKVMNSSKLQKSSNAVKEAHEQKPVQSCGITDFRQVCPAI